MFYSFANEDDSPMSNRRGRGQSRGVEERRGWGPQRKRVTHLQW